MSNKIFGLENINRADKYLNNTYRDVSLISEHSREKYNKFVVGDLVDVLSIKNSIRNIFTWIKGERVLDPEFGSDLAKILYNPINTYTSEQIISSIKFALDKYEPRAEIDKIINNNFIDDTEHNTIELEIIWHAKGIPDTKYTEKILL